MARRKQNSRGIAELTLLAVMWWSVGYLMGLLTTPERYPRCECASCECMELIPLTIREANELVRRWHRHRNPTVGGLFAIGCAIDDRIRGAVIVGRPVARGYDDGFTAEVTRCATDGTRNAVSKLYAAAWRAARAIGYRRLVTYTLTTESGASLRGAGWRCIGEVKGRSWNCSSRPRVDLYPMQQKFSWVKDLT